MTLLLYYIPSKGPSQVILISNDGVKSDTNTSNAGMGPKHIQTGIIAPINSACTGLAEFRLSAVSRIGHMEC